MTALAVALTIAAAPAPGPVPEMYRSVASVHWVVKDLAAVKQAWTRAGFPAVQDFGDVDLATKLRGQFVSARVRVALAVMDGLEVYWLQPLDAASAYSEFLARHGEGVFSLNHAAPSAAALDAEVSRLQGLGIAVLQSTDVNTDAGPLRIVHMDTGAEGRFVLGLVHGSVPGAGGAAPALPFRPRLAQFAFVARDLKAPSAFWSRLGLPAFELTHPAIRERLYRGQPAAFDQELGWQRHGKVTFEWIRSLVGPNVYDDFVRAHGEGVHHLAFAVDDFDQALAHWKAAGFDAVQSGAWGEAGKPGSGRYAYLDTDRAGGVFVELLWNQR
jgi:glyoxalase/bleomycin resistance protein/dioxygenase superfamily protein